MTQRIRLRRNHGICCCGGSRRANCFIWTSRARPLRGREPSVTGDRRPGRSRRAGGEYVHICIDDASRIAFSQIHPDQKKESAVAVLSAALVCYASLGITVGRVTTDNAPASSPKPSPDASRRLGVRHPRTNGKAERFIQTAL